MKKKFNKKNTRFPFWRLLTNAEAARGIEYETERPIGEIRTYSNVKLSDSWTKGKYAQIVDKGEEKPMAKDPLIKAWRELKRKIERGL